jgi:predicted dehydrogenase
VEARIERRDQMAASYGCPSYATLDAALKDKPWEAGVVAVPAHIHVPISLELLAAGLHVLIEKPLSVSEENIDRLLDYDGIRTIRVAYVYRHMEPVIALRRELLEGRLGTPLSAQVVCGEDFSRARPDYAGLYYARHETGGGAVQDVLTHFVNAMDWLVGPARLVQCQSANRKLRDVPVEDTVSCSVLHESGCLANYYISQGQAPKETSFTIHCEAGSLCADLSAMRLGIFAADFDRWEWTAMPCSRRDEFYERQAEDFLGAIEGAESRSCSLGEAVHSLRVNLAALESARSGHSREILP